MYKPPNAHLSYWNSDHESIDRTVTTIYIYLINYYSGHLEIYNHTVLLLTVPGRFFFVQSIVIVILILIRSFLVP